MPFLFGIGAKLLGISSAVHSIASKIPWKVWLAIGAAILLVVGIIWHGHAKKSFGDARYNAGYAVGFAAAKAEVEKARAGVETKGQTMAQDVRSKNDAKTVSIEHDTRVVLVRGPGRAACSPIAPATANGATGPGDAKGDAPVYPVPAGEGQQLIGMPIDAAAAFAKQDDKALADNASWWSWYDRYSAIIAGYQRQIANLTAKQGKPNK